MSHPRTALNEGADYYTSSRPEMLNLIPPGTQRLLELGCGEGGFAALVKRVRYAREYWAIEYEPDVAAKVGTSVDRLLIGDVDAHIDNLPDSYFDVIVANDVLEHLVDPWITLERLRPKLAPGGVVVASIPNFRYLPALARIVFERDFPQEAAGIFDRTHLRFFTYKSIRRMFTEAGYEIELIEGIGRQRFVWAALRVLTLGWFWDGLAIQFACVAKPRG